MSTTSGRRGAARVRAIRGRAITHEAAAQRALGASTRVPATTAPLLAEREQPAPLAAPLVALRPLRRSHGRGLVSRCCQVHVSLGSLGAVAAPLPHMWPASTWTRPVDALAYRAGFYKYSGKQ
ncbi:jg13886 [Pararge aegeria aegeria]|uniref:Jg13886 protein n=1 Tax=Pararge aegeria aegeria TaxID=348720 RepID=A0A8S4S9G7_9NEOP|nr:jg13886 [Pararge aegeria aegeria]